VFGCSAYGALREGWCGVWESVGFVICSLIKAQFVRMCVCMCGCACTRMHIFRVCGVRVRALCAYVHFCVHACILCVCVRARVVVCVRVSLYACMLCEWDECHAVCVVCMFVRVWVTSETHICSVVEAYPPVSRLIWMLMCDFFALCCSQCSRSLLCVVHSVFVCLFFG